MYSFPVGITAIAQIRNEFKTSLSQWLCLVGVMVGLMIIISDGAFHGNIYGLAISTLALILMTIFIYYSDKLVLHIGSQVFNFHMNFWSLVILICTYLWFDFTIEVPKGFAGKLALFCNGICYIFSYVLFFAGSKQIGIARASVLSQTEPLFATLLALVFLNQFLTFIEFFGFFLVVIALYYYEKYKNLSPIRNEKRH
tara:strand:+ start:287 stop:880 length:594 start_codon:yes stop_codon:yes gene_type:complete